MVVYTIYHVYVSEVRTMIPENNEFRHPRQKGSLDQVQSPQASEFPEDYEARYHGNENGAGPNFRESGMRNYRGDRGLNDFNSKAEGEIRLVPPAHEAPNPSSLEHRGEPEPYSYRSYGEPDEMMERPMSHHESRGVWEAVKDFFGVGPKGYSRSDGRIHDDVCEALTRDRTVDASEIEVEVKAGTVILRGQVADKWMKRRAEDCVEEVIGVLDVWNELKTSSKSASARPASGYAPGASGSMQTGDTDLDIGNHSHS